MTTSKADVEGMFRRLVRAAKAAGVDAEGWALEHGSATNGTAWRLRDEYLGSNRREAYLSLRAMEWAFEAVASLAGVR